MLGSHFHPELSHGTEGPSRGTIGRRRKASRLAGGETKADGRGREQDETLWQECRQSWSGGKAGWQQGFWTEENVGQSCGILTTIWQQVSVGWGLICADWRVEAGQQWDEVML